MTDLPPAFTIIILAAMMAAFCLSGYACSATMHATEVLPGLAWFLAMAAGLGVGIGGGLVLFAEINDRR